MKTRDMKTGTIIQYKTLRTGAYETAILLTSHKRDTRKCIVMNPSYPIRTVDLAYVMRFILPSGNRTWQDSSAIEFTDKQKELREKHPWM